MMSRLILWPGSRVALCTAALLVALLGGDGRASTADTSPEQSPRIELWHGDVQRVGHVGRPQPDFNLLGHIPEWRELDTLDWKLNEQAPVVLNFRSSRRLERDGDFNADIPIARLREGANHVVLTAKFRNGETAQRTATIHRQDGRCRFPLTIRWGDVSRAQDVGQYVDGRWRADAAGLRAVEAGYDRLFLIGDADWTDYEIQTSVTVHAVAAHLKKDAGIGLIAHFAGHVTGGPEHFPSGQPKWGYRPFGAIGWLRWRSNDTPPQVQYYPGANARQVDYGAFPFRVGQRYHLRFSCVNPPHATPEGQVTEYQFKIWPEGTLEPAAWNWSRRQESRDALRAGGIALVAHYVDATFGDITVRAIDSSLRAD